MGWYDAFAPFYDRALEDLYRPFRATAAERLELSAGQRVLDAGCGTGQSFDVLSPAVGPEGKVIGVDASSGMLAQARRRAEPMGNVELVEASLLELDAEHIVPVDRALCFLVLSALKDWPEAFAQVWTRVKPGGRLVIVDAHTKKLGFQGRMVNLTARADIRRRVWTELEAVADDFSFEKLDAPASVGGDIILARGDKPA